MAFEIFKCNPDKHRLADRLAGPNPTLTWTVDRFCDEINAGDTVFLWVTGPQRGMRVDMPPRGRPVKVVEQQLPSQQVSLEVSGDVGIVYSA